MILEQFYLGCLSQASYVIADEDSRRAIVLDPKRDVDEYLEFASRRGLTIKLVVLTHIHADFVPGYAELVAATGAEVAMGEHSAVDFPIRRLSDHERIYLGDRVTGAVVEVIATPGHTPESITLAAFRHADDQFPHALLTGDTLFLGDVGRPDLIVGGERTSDEMARDLFHSLRERILPLPDDVLIYPGHGAGSACGKSLSDERVSTLGAQRSSNYALSPMDEATFVGAVTVGLGEPPLYFHSTAALNRVGHLPSRPEPLRELEVDGVLEAVRDGALLLDVRDDESFSASHLRGSVGIGLSGRFAELAASLHLPGQPIVVAGSAEEVREARVRLARVGLDDIIGSFTDPTPAHIADASFTSASRLTPAQATRWLGEDPGVQVIDVRNPGELCDGALPGARNLPTPRFLDAIDQLDPARPILVYCAGGYRSLAVASLLGARGFGAVADLLGGFGAWLADTSSVGAEV